MELQEGKYYRDENGKKIGPMRKDPDFGRIWDCKNMFPNDDAFHWFSDGRAGYAARGAVDLVAEWVDEPMKTGTLQELNVQPGDVVEWLWNGATEVVTKDMISHYDGQYRIISRAPRDDTPKLWRDMTAEEKGALLLAAHEGRTVQGWDGDNWFDMMYPPWLEDDPYRVKPEPVRETVNMYYPDLPYSFNCAGRINGPTHRITFDTVNGKPDPASIRMERI